MCDVRDFSFWNYENDSIIRIHLLLGYMNFGFTKLKYASSVLGNEKQPANSIIEYCSIQRDMRGYLLCIEQSIYAFIKL